MADLKPTMDDMLAGDRDERFAAMIHADGTKLRSTNAVTGRPVQNPMNLIHMGDILQGAYNREDPAKTLAKYESLTTASFGTLWGEMKDTGIAALFPPEMQALISKLYTDRGAPGSALDGSTGGGDTSTDEPDPTQNSNGKVNKQGWTWPTQGRTVTSGVGMRTHPISGDQRMHKGLDINLETGDPVYAAKAGTVYDTPYDAEGFGNYIMILHDDAMSLYGHLSSTADGSSRHNVKKGDKVTAGQQIGKGGSTGGSTGAHLHFEIRKAKTRAEYFEQAPLNPLDYLPKD